MSADPYNSLLDEMERTTAPKPPRAPKLSVPKPQPAVDPNLDSFVKDIIGEASRRSGFTYKLGEGPRTAAQQAGKVAQGVSWTYNSAHMHGRGRDVLAFDPQGNYIKDGSHPAYKTLGEVYGERAATAPVPVKWGVVRNGRQVDPGHFELGRAAAADPYSQLLDELEASPATSVSETVLPETGAALPVVSPAPVGVQPPSSVNEVEERPEDFADLQRPAPSPYTPEGRAQRGAKLQAEAQGGALYRIPVGTGRPEEAARAGAEYIAKKIGATPEFVESWLKSKNIGPQFGGQSSAPTGHAVIPTELLGQMRKDYRASLSLPARAVANVREIAATHTPGEVLAGVAGEAAKPVVAAAQAALPAAQAVGDAASYMDTYLWSRAAGLPDESAQIVADARLKGVKTPLSNPVGHVLKNVPLVRENPRAQAIAEFAGELAQPSNLIPVGAGKYLGSGVRAAAEAGESAGRVGRAASKLRDASLYTPDIPREAFKPLGDTRVLGDLTRRIDTTGALPDVPAGTIPAPRLVKRAESPGAELGVSEAAFAEKPPVEATQASVSPITETIIRHSDPRIDGGKVIGQTPDGKLKVENNEGGVSVVKHPRKGGNREAALVRREVESEAPSASVVGVTTPVGEGYGTGSNKTLLPMPSTGDFRADNTKYLTEVLPEEFDVYREVKIQPGQEVNLTEPGRSWAETRAGAVGYATVPGESVILKARAKRSDVDVDGTLRSRQRYGEPEINFKPGARLDAQIVERGGKPVEVLNANQTQLPKIVSPRTGSGAAIDASRAGQIAPADGGGRQAANLRGVPERVEGTSTPDRLSAPVPGPRAFRAQMKRHFGLDDRKADAVLELTEARARAWAKEQGKDASDYYVERFGGIVRGGEPVGEQLNQTASGLRLRDEVMGAHHGQVDGVLTAERDGKAIGSLKYSLFGDEAHIDMVQVAPDARRQGVGIELVRELQAQNPDRKLNWGMTTPDGTALRLSYEAKHPPISKKDAQFNRREFLKDSRVKQVVYHATRGDFEEFDTTKGDLGAHFGSREHANRVIERRAGSPTGAASVMPVYLRLNNPLRLKDTGTFHADGIAPQLAAKGIISKAEAKKIVKEIDENWRLREKYDPYLRDLIKERGHDGVVYRNEFEGGGDSYIAFDSEQIKSATGNKGTFDPSDPNILRQENKAAVEFMKDSRAIIRAFSQADVSSAVHELGHVFRRDLSPELLRDAEDAIGVQHGAKWTELQEEKFARGFERYLRDGKSPSEKLRRVYESFKSWLETIYPSIRSKTSPLYGMANPKLVKVFDRMLDASPKGDYGQLTHALHKAPDAGTPAFFENAQVKRALGLKPDASTEDVRWALAGAVGKPRSSHISPDDVRAWADSKNLQGAARVALDDAVAKFEAKTGRVDSVAPTDATPESLAPADSLIQNDPQFIENYYAGKTTDEEFTKRAREAGLNRAEIRAVVADAREAGQVRSPEKVQPRVREGEAGRGGNRRPDRRDDVDVLYQSDPASVPEEILDKSVGTVSLRGDELGDASVSLKELRQRAFAHARAHYQGRPVRNEDKGWDINISRKGLSHTMHHSAQPVFVRSMVALPELLRKAVWIGERPNADAASLAEVSRYHTFYAPLEVGGQLYRVKMKVAETVAGKKFYDHRLTEIERPADSPTAVTEFKTGTTAGSSAGAQYTIRQLVGDINDPDILYQSSESDALRRFREVTAKARTGEAKRLEQSIADLERRIEEKDITPKGRPQPRAVTAEVAQLRARRDTLRKEFDALKRSMPVQGPRLSEGRGRKEGPQLAEAPLQGPKQAEVVPGRDSNLTDLFRTPLSNLDFKGTYERLGGEPGKKVSDAFRDAQFQTDERLNELRKTTPEDKLEEVERVVRREELDRLRAKLRPLVKQLKDGGKPDLADDVLAHLNALSGTPTKFEKQVGNLIRETPGLGRMVKNPDLAMRHAAARLTGLQATLKLKYNIRSSIVNLTDPLTTLWPYASTADMAAVYADLLKPSTRKMLADKGVTGGVTKLDEAGLVKTRQGLGDKLSPFRKASEVNRSVAYLYGLKEAKRAGKVGEDAHRLALDWAKKVEFDNSVWNAPPVLRTSAGKVLGQFKGYAVKSFENLANVVRKKETDKAFTRAARVSKFVAGKGVVGGVRAGGVLTKYAGYYAAGALAYQLMQKGYSKEEAQKVADAVYYGAPALIGLDLSGSVMMFEPPFGNSLTEQVVNTVGGPTIGTGLKLGQAAKDAYSAEDGKQKSREEKLKTIGERSINALTPYYKMGRSGVQTAQGQPTQKLGSTEVPVTTYEGVMKALGFTLTKQTKFYDAQGFQKPNTGRVQRRSATR